MKIEVQDEVKVVVRRNVVVGIRIDSEGREILNYALGKVAGPGDHVVVVHVCRRNDQIKKDKPLLDSCLEDFQNLCNSKKVNVTGEVLAGSSVRRVLVKEAKKCAAVAVVVGINHRTGLRFWTSIARYCSSQLPSATDVLAIHNGKLVFRRCLENQPPGVKGNARPSLDLMGAKGQSEFGDSEAETETERSSSEAISCSECGSGDSVGDLKDAKVALNPCCKKVPSRSISFINMVDLSEEQPGWPLLQSAASLTPQTGESRNMSVVQWVMSLPNRFPNQNSDNALERATSNVLPGLMEPNSSGWKWFGIEVLRAATSQFSEENLIGRGGCNRVYKGILPDGKPVAVKVLKTSTEAQNTFTLEIDIISSLKHDHISRLLGICINNNELISVYHFYSKGSLDENLHGKIKLESALSWEVRFKVAVEIAEALNYLHNEASRPVIHRDVKSSNILLSDGFESQLSDFGLAIWGPTDSSSLTEEDIVGTFGYLAPEYFMYGKVSDKIDVYAFGVVLLELLSGREPISSENPKGQESLVMWAKPLMESGDVNGMVDPHLDGKFDEKQVKRMVLAATLCITQAARLRPKMSQILKLLRGDIDVEQWVNSESPELEDSEKQEDDNNNDDEVYPTSSAESHLSLALLDVDDPSTSFGSTDQNNNLSNFSLEDYFKDRVWSRSPSFD